ncbi:MAG: HNH endonuclease [Gammaproteobacteria bacterium]|nr:HNH endonuclease [Gammaproteobacteria bacterium]
MAPYSELAEPLGDLLREFGPPRKAVHPSFPFWRLRADGVWALDGAAEVTVTKSGDAHEGALRKHNIHGGFPEAIYDALHQDPGLAMRVAHSLLDAHFPWTRHREILRAVGIEADFVESRRRRRDSAFRGRVLEAYVYRCAVCGFAVRLGDRPVAIDAAHIRWHQAHGPATISNGIALCSLHHELFDAGTFTLAGERLHPSRLKYSRPRRSTASAQRVAEVGPTRDSIPRPVVVVAPLITGEGVEEALGRYHGMPVRLPADRDLWPAPTYLKWHARQVFKSSADSARSLRPS